MVDGRWWGDVEGKRGLESAGEVSGIFYEAGLQPAWMRVVWTQRVALGWYECGPLARERQADGEFWTNG